jgi:hypothetical protein
MSAKVILSPLLIAALALAAGSHAASAPGSQGASSSGADESSLAPGAWPAAAPATFRRLLRGLPRAHALQAASEAGERRGEGGPYI